MRRMRVLLFQLFAAHLARSSNASLLPQPSPNASEPSPSPMPSPDEADYSYGAGYSYGALWNSRSRHDASYDAVDLMWPWDDGWPELDFPTEPPTGPQPPPRSPGEGMPPPPPLATATCGTKTPEQAIRDGDLIAFDCAQHAPRALRSN